MDCAQEGHDRSQRVGIQAENRQLQTILPSETVAHQQELVDDCDSE